MSTTQENDQASMQEPEKTVEVSDLRIALCLSGGGSRAFAFHLGCLRALHRLDLLKSVRVISTVSGGSVIGAMYSYGPDSDFNEFEKKALAFLRSGAQMDAFLHWIYSGRFVLNILNLFLVLLVQLILWPVEFFFEWSPPRFCYPRRWFSRLDSLRCILERKWMKDFKLNQPQRPDLDVIINSCELDSFSALRFGSKHISCWPLGKASSLNFPVAKAVACSAAYPGFLPAMDLKLDFVGRNGSTRKERAVLTDGGVYDNLGLTPVFPDRNPEYSYVSSKCNVIIACDAGAGVSRAWAHHQWMVPRLIRSFSAVMRRVQGFNFKALHDYKSKGEIQGFILSYLGQDDEKLPRIPKNFVRRDVVVDYPTNFKAMSEKWIDRLTARGEQLTCILAEEYLSGGQSIKKSRTTK
jgi:NTE family protein